MGRRPGRNRVGDQRGGGLSPLNTSLSFQDPAAVPGFLNPFLQPAQHSPASASPVPSTFHAPGLLSLPAQLCSHLSEQLAAPGPQENLPFLSLIVVLIPSSQGTQSWSLFSHIQGPTCFQKVAKPMGSHALPNLPLTCSVVARWCGGRQEGVTEKTRHS